VLNFTLKNVEHFKNLTKKQTGCIFRTDPMYY